MGLLFADLRFGRANCADLRPAVAQHTQLNAFLVDFRDLLLPECAILG
jgi:hypothetical protein